MAHTTNLGFFGSSRFNRCKNASIILSFLLVSIFSCSQDKYGKYLTCASQSHLVHRNWLGLPVRLTRCPQFGSPHPRCDQDSSSCSLGSFLLRSDSGLLARFSEYFINSSYASFTTSGNGSSFNGSSASCTSSDG